MVGHEARMEEGRSGFQNFNKKLEERDLYEGLSVDGKKILERILRKSVNTRNLVNSADGRDYWRAIVIAAFSL